ncbi:hypothetical protein [Pseudomonas helleri]|uniref:Uncharacterized protein n=1 Tax=Pseudomonas helleri TaxID=1608996 RepID=A0A7X1Y833_9PSED|nr:hypothetical protein [Pseudomonas helleri]MQT93013.1 hypothetical protein [Pseudomonas helleri]MQU31155.1 hypothetical protein [Pseudomonas helleri]
MSVGRVLIIPGLKFNNPDAPKLVEVDVIESAGSLLLIDPTHPSGVWPGGIGPSGSTLRNVLWKKAQAVYGAGSEASLVPTLNYAGMSGATGLLERSSKGGLHALVSQAPGLVSAKNTPYARINIDLELRKWLFQNPTNDLYISIWGQVTRPYKTGVVDSTYTGMSATALVELATGGGNQRLVLGKKTEVQNELGKLSNSESASGPVFMNGASRGWLTNPALETSIFTSLLGVGNTGLNNTYTSGASTAKTRWPSWIIYRVYVEDLTVSGRTYQQVHDIDYALYEKNVLCEGGRYYGDTYTVPSVLP